MARCHRRAAQPHQQLSQGNIGGPGPSQTSMHGIMGSHGYPQTPRMPMVSPAQLAARQALPKPSLPSTVPQQGSLAGDMARDPLGQLARVGVGAPNDQNRVGPGEVLPRGPGGYSAAYATAPLSYNRQQAKLHPALEAFRRMVHLQTAQAVHLSAAQEVGFQLSHRLQAQAHRWVAEALADGTGRQWAGRRADGHLPEALVAQVAQEALAVAKVRTLTSQEAGAPALGRHAGG